MRVLYLVLVGVVLGLAPGAHANPTKGNSTSTGGCLSSGCHSATTGKVSITSAITTNLGTQLDGNVRGTLDTFKVVQGQTVSIPIVVSAGSSADNFGLGVYELTHGGVKNSQTNILSYSGISAEFLRVGTATNLPNPRYIYDVTPLGSQQTVTFSMLVNSSTPVDFYDVQIQFGTFDGNSKWAQQERVYIQVIAAPEPAQCALLLIPLMRCLLRRRR